MISIEEKRERMDCALAAAGPRTQWEEEFMAEMERKIRNELWVPTDEQLRKAEEIAQR